MKAPPCNRTTAPGLKLTLHRNTEGGRSGRARLRVSCCAKPGAPEILLASFEALQKPALHNKRYSRALTDFAQQAILAYECGWTQEGLQAALAQDRSSGGSSTRSGGAGAPAADAVAAAALSSEQECVNYVCLVWLTLTVGGLAKSTVVRWAPQGATDAPPPAPVVGPVTAQKWRGFVLLICRGYFEKRMAWYPLERLQLELALATGRREAPSDVAELAQVVYTTLHEVAPQFPSRF